MALESIDLSTIGARLGFDAGLATLSGPTSAVALFSDDLVDLTGSTDAPILILSTGEVADVFDANISGEQGTDLGLEGGVNDDIVLTIDFIKGDADNFLIFDMTFLSEEFDEFVDRGFDDFFTATLNGAEITSISIDDAPFDTNLSTEGTQFDARVETLRFTTQLNTNILVNSLELRIADEGDGRLDSAAFLNNFELRANTIFLDFGGAGGEDVVFDTLLDEDLVFTTPDAVLTNGEIVDIVEGVRDIFDGFAVEFVTARPLFDDFATIHVGGAFDDLPTILQSDPSVISFSEAIDPRNLSNTDQAVVLSEEIVEVTDGDAKVGLLAQTIAREAAHLLGLRNVEDREAVVFPTPGESRVALTATSAVASVADDGSILVSDILQDIPNELANTVGVIGAAERPVPGLGETSFSVFTFETGAAAPQVFGVRAAVVDGDDNITALSDLGDFGPNDILHFTASALDIDRVILIARSELGGDFDLVLSSGDAGDFSFAGRTQGDIIDVLGVSVEDFRGGAFSFVPTAGGAPLAAPFEFTTNITGQPVQVGDDGPNTLATAPTGGSLFGLGGDDILIGDAGVDGLFGGDGDDTLTGDAGDDDLRGGDGDDNLSGGGDDDIISGGTGADTIDGGEGADTIFGGLGDLVDGGLGFDVLQTDLAFADITLSDGDPGFVLTADGGVLTVTGVEQFRFADATLSVGQLSAFLATGDPGGVDGDQGEVDPDGGRIDGGENDDTLDGGPGADQIIGNGGDDLIVAGGGDDSVFGGQGDDTIRGQEGADVLNGGAGQDLILGGAGADMLIGRGDDDTLRGGAGADTVLGGFGEDLLSGGGGRDEMNGGAGADIVRGGGDNDSLRGGGGDDVVNGGGGDDILNGGRGADTLRGGLGEDVFQFTTGDGADRIRDFQQGLDRIEILRGVEEFSDIGISQSGGNTVISFANVSIIVERQDRSDFSEADFIF